MGLPSAGGRGRIHPRLELGVYVNLEGARQKRELQFVERRVRRITAEQAVQVLVSVAAQEREAEPFGPLVLPVGRAQAADTSSAFPTMASTSSGFTSW